MNSIKIILIACCCLLTLSSQAADKVNFYEGSFPSVRQSAKINNRPFFAYFTASWCMPCRLMDETTWLDPNLADYIASNYYGVKIDVDDFDGYAYKDRYDVKAFPTIILFAPDGSILKRIEGSVTGSELLSSLREYDSYNSKPTGGSTNVVVTEPVYAPPPVVYNPLPTTQNTLPAPSYTPPAATVVPPVASKNGKQISGSGLFRFSVEREPSEGFSVQVGVYAEYGNVLREVEGFQKKFNQPILVHIDELGDKTVYRVLIGSFESRDQADKYKVKILESGVLDALVRDLKAFK